jgi:hypothetical protein
MACLKMCCISGYSASNNVGNVQAALKKEKSVDEIVARNGI